MGQISESDIENRLIFVESLFEKNGAVPVEINEKNREKFGQRKIFKFGDSYFRVGDFLFDGSDEPYMVISCTDEEKFANVGLMDDVEAISFDLTDEELETRVRCAFGLEESDPEDSEK